MLGTPRGRHARSGGPHVDGDGDSIAALDRMRALRADLSRADSAARFRGLGVDVFLGAGRFAGPDALTVRDAVDHDVTLRFRRAIVASGARAALPLIEGLAEVGYLTNETVFKLNARPAHLLVGGGGPSGCELAQAFARLGSVVTILNAGVRLLPRDDADAAQVLEHALVAVWRHISATRRVHDRAPSRPRPRRRPGRGRPGRRGPPQGASGSSG